MDNIFIKHIVLPCISTRSVREVVIAALAALGLALSSPLVAAQATYRYTGNAFTFFSCGPTSDGQGTLSCADPGPNANTSYTATDRVTATLSFDSPLAANLDLAEVQSLPGFELSMHDGHQTVTTANGPVGLIARVSTDGSGQISAWRLIINLGNAANSGVSTQNWFNTATSRNVMSDTGTLACCHPTIAGDIGRVSDNPGTWDSGAPTPEQMVSGLITVLQEMNIPQQGASLTDKLQKILNDISTQNGLACTDLQGFENQVKAQTGKKITLAQASQLLAAAADIGAALDCGS